MNQLEETTMSEERFAIASFDHPKNIRIGNGRILWAKACTCTAGIHHPEGWILPGGERTQDSARAHAAALTIDELSGAAS
jgi:hypothetical protein